jgi:hypothetical protein
MKFGYVHRNSPIATVNSVYGPWFLFLTTKCFLCSGHLENYTSDYTIQVLVGYCSVYIFMQTFMIPGTIFMSLLAGSLFGQLRGVALVVFAASAGASSCFFLSKLIGKPLVFSLWPDKLMFFQKQVGINSNILVALLIVLNIRFKILRGIRSLLKRCNFSFFPGCQKKRKAVELHAFSQGHPNIAKHLH